MMFKVILIKLIPEGISANFIKVKGKFKKANLENHYFLYDIILNTF